ncbi:MAG: ImuA family protein [Hyphomicrobium sp.]
MAKTALATEPVGRAGVLQALRATIANLERPMLRPASSRVTVALQRGRWQLGCAEADALLPEGGLALGAVHEIKPAGSARGSASAADWMAGLGFALRLAALRFHQLEGAGRDQAMMLWCWPQAFANEFGRLSLQGLIHLGIDPARVLIVETPRQSDALTALEEGLKSGRLALAAGIVKDVDLNAGRRLSLAAGARGTPCLLATHPAAHGAAATATRWRVARAPSGPHLFDPKSPGAPRFRLALERCRRRPQSTDAAPFVVEWCDETLRFRMASQLANDAARPRRAAYGS